MDKKVTFLIMGGASDLAERLLIPGAADYLSDEGRSGDNVTILGVGRTDHGDYPGWVRDAVNNGAEHAGDDVAKSLSEGARFLEADATDADDLARVLGEVDADQRLIIYYALAPAVTGDSIDALAGADLPADTVIALEKPIGTDADSAREIEERALKVVDESHLYRVDHFLHEPAVAGLIGAASANGLLKSALNNVAVEKIDVVYEETLALEGRAEFYDSTGAAEDMLQSHLLQAVIHILAGGGDESVADLLQRTTADPAKARRGQYTAGDVGGKSIPAYTDEEGIDDGSTTETVAQIELAVDTDRWRGVPVILRSGKAFGEERKEITVTFRSADEDADAPQLVATFDGDVRLRLLVPSTDGAEWQDLDLSGQLPGRETTPYSGVVRALATGSSRGEVPAGTAALAWEVLDPVLTAFENDDVELEKYPAGSATLSDWGA